MEIAPALEILVREPDGFSIWNGPPFDVGQPNVKLERVPCTAAKLSENGSRLMVMESSSLIHVYNCNGFSKMKSFNIPSITGSTLSPCGTYVQTFQKSTSPQEKNVVVWKIETAAAVYQHFQKNMTKTTWPAIQFSSDEFVACRMATNEIQFFDGKDFSKGIISRLRVPGVTAIELSKSPGSHVAAFVAESKAFWDYTEKKLLGTTKAECSVTSEWSPDGLYFMTATTAPRLQIDNGIKIFHYNGSLYFKKMFNKLYQADWKPEAPERFGDIADLVKSISTIKIDELKPQANASQVFSIGAMNASQASTKVSTNTVQKPTAYRPPHAKNVAAAQAELFKGISAAEETSKNAMRNKKRREKQREKKAAEGSAATASDDS